MDGIKKDLINYYITDTKLDLERCGLERSTIDNIQSFMRGTGPFKPVVISITSELRNKPVKEVQKIINTLMSKEVFSRIDKSNLISPMEVLSNTEEQRTLLERFCKRAILLSVLSIKKNIKKDLDFLNKMVNNNELFLIPEKDKIIKAYNNFFPSFYTYILNRHDKDYHYVLPYMSTKDYKLGYTALSKNSRGGNASNDVIEEVKKKLHGMSSKHNIKKIYDMNDVKRLDTLLENNKINQLILSGDLTLSPEFNRITRSILNNDATVEEREKYFGELFKLKDPSKFDMKSLHSLYNAEDDKENFLKYLVDKTLHKQFNTSDLSDTDQKQLQVIALVDDLFNKILKGDYTDNSLNMKDDDMKFILMLETLNSIKGSTNGNSDNKKSNITINLFKDVDHTSVNSDKISFV
jgi:hypothetical protein